MNTLFIPKLFGWTALFILCLNGTSHAQGHVGNGGDAIVCGSKVRLLDQYEAELRGTPIDHLEGNSIREKVDGVVNSVLRLDRVNGILLQKFTRPMLDEVERYSRTQKTQGLMAFKDVELSDIDDSQELYIPKGCSKLQLVIQQSDAVIQSPLSIERAKYVVQSELWKNMNEDSQALTLLHEAWYRIALSRNAKNSIFTRYINATTASKPTFEVYANALVQAPITLPRHEVKRELKRGQRVYQETYIEPEIHELDFLLPIRQDEFLHLDLKPTTREAGLRCHGVRGTSLYPLPMDVRSETKEMDPFYRQIKYSPDKICLDETSGNVLKASSHGTLWAGPPDGLYISLDQGFAKIRRGSVMRVVLSFGLLMFLEEAIKKDRIVEIEYVPGLIRISIDRPEFDVRYKVKGRVLARNFTTIEISSSTGEVISIR